MIFSEDANSFSLAASPFKSEEQLGKGLWLALVGANETPPHIGLISNGKYYSLAARKVDRGSPAEKLLNILNRKQIPTLFVQFAANDAGAQNFEPLQHIYKNLPTLGNTEQTCLSPVKQFLAECISSEFEKTDYVYELLAVAEKKGLIKECISLFCNAVNSKRITLPKYTMVQIRNKILQLSQQTVN